MPFDNADVVITTTKPPAFDRIAGITRERGNVYGSFEDNADVAQRLKTALRGEPVTWLDLPADVREALDLIARCVTDRIRTQKSVAKT